MSQAEHPILANFSQAVTSSEVIKGEETLVERDPKPTKKEKEKKTSEEDEPAIKK